MCCLSGKWRLTTVQASRQSIGYTTNGCNSFAHGKGVGRGLVLAASFVAASQEEGQRIVLVKHPDACYHAFAAMSIAIPTYV